MTHHLLPTHSLSFDELDGKGLLPILVSAVNKSLFLFFSFFCFLIVELLLNEYCFFPNRQEVESDQTQLFCGQSEPFFHCQSKAKTYPFQYPPTQKLHSFFFLKSLSQTPLYFSVIYILIMHKRSPFKNNN